MRVGAVRERKVREYRVALTPDGARVLVESGHQVVVETTAGEGSGFSDEEYVAIGARIAKSMEEVIGETDLVTKVKEPTPEEVAAMRPGQALFCFLHLAPEVELTRSLLEREVIAIGFETVQTDDAWRSRSGPITCSAIREGRGFSWAVSRALRAGMWWCLAAAWPEPPPFGLRWASGQRSKSSTSTTAVSPTSTTSSAGGSEPSTRFRLRLNDPSYRPICSLGPSWFPVRVLRTWYVVHWWSECGAVL